MLRMLLQDQSEPQDPDFHLALDAIRQFRIALDGVIRRQRSEETRRRTRPASRGEKLDLEALIRLELMANGFVDALVELEESIHAAARFARSVHSAFVDEMGKEELMAYRLYLYFYKNGFIRLFSVLDKLGFFINELYGLRTEKVKPRFSYYTVLRQMKGRHAEPALEHKLSELKIAYADTMQRLRRLRNIEIHNLNMEMIDDMFRAKQYSLQDGRQKVEPLSENMRDLERGFEKVCRAVAIVFNHAKTSL